MATFKLFFCSINQSTTLFECLIFQLAPRPTHRGHYLSYLFVFKIDSLTSFGITISLQYFCLKNEVTEAILNENERKAAIFSKGLSDVNCNNPGRQFTIQSGCPRWERGLKNEFLYSTSWQTLIHPAMFFRPQGIIIGWQWSWPSGPWQFTAPQGIPLLSIYVFSKVIFTTIWDEG